MGKTLLALAAVAAVVLGPLRAGAEDPLPSWKEGRAKRAIVEFVKRTTRAGSAEFVRPEERVAVFDQDGTLWAEQPVVQGAFVLWKLRQLAERDPSLRQRQPFRAALEGDLAYFHEDPEAKVMQLVAATHAGATDEEFAEDVRAFLDTARHPKLGVPYTQLTYRPMRELLDYLRANGFETWICSGGGVDFMRVYAERAYGIPPERVIGSGLRKELARRNRRGVLLRKAEVRTVNDKAEKPVNIDVQIGKRPVFAAGNVRSGGDVAMLEYSKGRAGPSFQIVVNHDDGAREFAYAEKDGATLAAAEANGFTVVSVKDDWATVFARPPQARRPPGG
jgi:phosphoserine phosphatase